MKVWKGKFAVASAVFAALLAITAPSALALTNNLATALTITSGVESGFDTGATIGLSILVFLVALGYVLRGIMVGKKAR